MVFLGSLSKILGAKVQQSLPGDELVYMLLGLLLHVEVAFSVGSFGPFGPSQLLIACSVPDCK